MNLYDTFLELGYYKVYSIEDFYENPSVAAFVPFIEKYSPEIAEIQEVPSAISLICIEGKLSYLFRDKNGEIVYNEKLGNERMRQIIAYGLKPLLASQVINEKEAENIYFWFKTVDGRHQQIGKFHKYVFVREQEYTIYSYFGRGQKCIILALDHIQF